MRKKLLVSAKFFALPLLLMMSCDIVNESELSVGFLSGTFTDWHYGSDKEIKMILETEATNQFVVVGSSRISVDGSFAIDSLDSPPVEYLEPISEGPGDENEDDDECIKNYEISDMEGMTVFAHLAITNAGTNEIIGHAYKATSEFNSLDSQNGTSIVEYIYSLNDLSVVGTETCTFPNGQTETTEVIAYVTAGWNALTSRTIMLTDGSFVREITSGEPIGAEWQNDLNGDHQIIDYPFQIGGSFDQWDGSMDKKLVLGFEDFRDGQLVIYAESDISAEGNFGFQTAINPPREMMNYVTSDYPLPDGCSMILNANNPYARTATAMFYITDMSTENVLGQAGLALLQADKNPILPGDFTVQITFVDRPVSVNGTQECANSNDDIFSAEVTYINVTAFEGWNFFSRVILSTENDSLTAEMRPGIMDGALWYYHMDGINSNID
ncbi:hypothetical protein ACFLTH_11580 [Bacteroidota bacterium]